MATEPEPEPILTEAEALDQLQEHVASEGWGMTDSTLLRYYKWKGSRIEKAKKAISETVQWRMNEMPETKNYDHCKAQLDTMASYIHGCDAEGNCTIYMRASRDPPGTVEEKVDTIIYNLEEATKIMQYNTAIGVSNAHKVNYIIDLSGFTLSNSKRDVSACMQWASILLAHYPLTLRKCYLLNYPYAFRMFWGLIRPFISEKDAALIEWVAETEPAPLREYFEKQNFNPKWLETDFGGDLEPATHINTPSNAVNYKPFFTENDPPLVATHA
eukprot:TRINITY_DN34451_c0_g1_i1.p1 TRINITY_DN34451_c0_g1~~TRINITY_DN34451_c0_g1_i1.p1  ORF type:complete len:294 (+),score=60.67 TRINITY_DN34451_c0_g1_i1:67-882(+)